MCVRACAQERANERLVNRSGPVWASSDLRPWGLGLPTLKRAGHCPVPSKMPWALVAVGTLAGLGLFLQRRGCQLTARLPAGPLRVRRLTAGPGGEEGRAGLP